MDYEQRFKDIQKTIDDRNDALDLIIKKFIFDADNLCVKDLTKLYL